MILTRLVTVGDREVAVRELIVAEVRAWIGDDSPEADLHPALIAALALLDPQDPADVQALLGLERMTDLAVEELDGAAPSEIRALVAACREVNADFFGLLGRQRQAARPASESASSAPP